MSRSHSVFRGSVSASRLNAGIVMLVVVVLHLTAMNTHASDWAIETVDSVSDINNGIDIEANDPNRVHLYYDNTYPSVNIYAARDTTSWSYWSRNDYSAIDLEVDDDGHPCMFVSPVGTNAAEYWQEETVGNWWYWPNLVSNMSAGNAELEINSSGTPILSYLDLSTQSLVCGTITGDLWSSPSYLSETVVSRSAFNTADPLIKMVLDHDEQPCVLWYEAMSEELKWARRSTGGLWSVETIRNGSFPTGFDAAFDSSDNLHVAYSASGSGSTYQMHHAVYNGTSWQDYQVDANTNQVGSLVIDSQDQPHLAYVKFDHGAAKDEVKYATFYDNQWHGETVMVLADDGSEGVEEVVMDVDSADHLHMAFRGDADVLRYARLDEVPRPSPWDECVLLASKDVQATYTSSVGFIIDEGYYSINVYDSASVETDNRGIIKFDLDDLHPGVDIVSVKLCIDVSMTTSSGSDGPTPSVYAFLDDGQVRPEDAEKTQNLVGTSDPILGLGLHYIDLDPAAIEALRLQGDDLALLLVGTSFNVTFNAIENTLGDCASLVFEVTPTPIPGDANKDNVVDEDDAALVATNWYVPNVGWGGGDFNGDGIVNGIDASILAANWGQTGNESQTTVPEPSAAIFLVGAMISMLGYRRRRGL